MNLRIVRSSTLSLHSLNNILKCHFKTKAKPSIVTELEVEDVPTYDIESIHTEDNIQKVRNKSRLKDHHRNILLGRKPYDQSQEWYHDTVWYRKRMLGRYGIAAADCSPAIVWPTKEQIEDARAYESVVYPTKLQDLWKEIKKTKEEEAIAIRQRDEEIDKVVAKFDDWRSALAAKIKKKEMALLEAKKKKELELEELYEQFGQHIDPKDERFQEFLEKKEKEKKKLKKEAKKKLREEKMLAYISQMNNANASKPEEIKPDESVPVSELTQNENNEIKSKKENE